MPPRMVRCGAPRDLLLLDPFTGGETRRRSEESPDQEAYRPPLMGWW